MKRGRHHQQGERRMEADTLLMQSLHVPARVALQRYSQEKMGGVGWRQTIQDKHENITSTLITCLTGESLTLLYRSCVFHIFACFPLQRWEQPSKHHKTHFPAAYPTALRAQMSDIEPVATVHDWWGIIPELTHYKLLCTWLAAFGDAAEMCLLLEDLQACADVWLLFHTSELFWIS